MARFLFSLFFLSFPFGIYFLAKWIVLKLKQGQHTVYSILRPLYLVAEAMLAMILPCALIILIYSQDWYNYLQIELGVVWFVWPLYAAVYKQTKVYVWERLLFWGCAIYTFPTVLWIVLVLGT